MSNHIQIRAVKVELLRTGPSHNQLLSPVTPCLGICDGAIHLLAHGVPDAEVDERSYGMKPGQEVISGERFASAFARLVTQRYPALLRGAHKQRADRVKNLAGQLPMEGPFRIECLGLRAGSNKRLAESSYWVADALDLQLRTVKDKARAREIYADMDRHLADCYAYLEDALKEYKEAANGVLPNRLGVGRHRTATLHWMLGQQLCLSAVLGATVPDGTWETARRCAEAFLEDADADAEGRRWPHGTLTELWLLKLVDAEHVALTESDPDQATRERCAAQREAKRHATELIKLARSRGDVQVSATVEQINCYLGWWASELFEFAADAWPGNRSSKPPTWDGLGVRKLAQALVDILTNRGRGKHPAWAFEPDPVRPDDDEAEPAAALPAPTELALPAPATVVAAAAATAGPAPAATAFLSKTTKAVATPRGAKDGAPFLSLEMLPAGHGDCLWREYGQGKEANRVLVDCGTVFHHSDNEAIARVIVAHGEQGTTRPTLWFNYESDDNRDWKNPQLQQQHAYEAVHPTAEQARLGMALRL